MGLWADFKKFATRGNFAAMAVGIVIGLAVVAVVGALVTDVVNPLVGLAGAGNLNNLGNVTIKNSYFQFGSLASAALNFVVVLVVVFFAIAYPMEKAQERLEAKKPKGPPTTRECPACFMSINVKATRCPYCTSEVTPLAPPPTPPVVAGAAAK